MKINANYLTSEPWSERMKIEGNEPFSGLMKWPAIRDWKKMMSIPARKNLIPANRIIESVSALSKYSSEEESYSCK